MTILLALKKATLHGSEFHFIGCDATRKAKKKSVDTKDAPPVTIDINGSSLKHKIIVRHLIVEVSDDTLGNKVRQICYLLEHSRGLGRREMSSQSQ